MVNAMKQSNDHTPVPFCVGSVMLVQFHGESLIPCSVCFLITTTYTKRASYGSLGRSLRGNREPSVSLQYLRGNRETPPVSLQYLVETGLDHKKTSI